MGRVADAHHRRDGFQGAFWQVCGGAWRNEGAASKRIFEETAEARRVWLRVLAKLRLQDCERILERLKRKNPREGISVSGRDLRDIDLAMVGIFAEMQGESMRRAKPQTATEVFMDALAASRAIDSRF